MLVSVTTNPRVSIKFGVVPPLTQKLPEELLKGGIGIVVKIPSQL
jgi:hypothetical protein